MDLETPSEFAAPVEQFLGGLTVKSFATRSGKTRVAYSRLQIDDDGELQELRVRLKNADMPVFDEGGIVCCYARSEKSWVVESSSVTWEA